jgi:hypothetical protein
MKYKKYINRENMNYRNMKLKQYKYERENPYKCEACGDRFKTQLELSKHQHYFCTGGW